MELDSERSREPVYEDASSPQTEEDDDTEELGGESHKSTTRPETHSHRFSSNSRPSQSDTDAGHNMSWVLYTEDQNKKEASSGPFSFHRRFDQNIGPSFDLCEADPSALKELETDFASQCTDDGVDLLKYDNNQVEETAFTLCSEVDCKSAGTDKATGVEDASLDICENSVTEFSYQVASKASLSTTSLVSEKSVNEEIQEQTGTNAFNDSEKPNDPLIPKEMEPEESQTEKGSTATKRDLNDYSKQEQKAMLVVSSQKLITDIVFAVEENETAESDDNANDCKGQLELCLERQPLKCCCYPVKVCQNQVRIDESFFKAAKVGAKYALTIIKPPKKITTLLLRLFEIAFFVLSLYVYADEAAEEGFTKKLSDSKFTLVIFCLATIDVIGAVVIGMVSLILSAQKEIRLESYVLAGEDKKPSELIRATQKSGWITVYEFCSKFLLLLLIYPLLIGDIYEFALLWAVTNATSVQVNVTGKNLALSASDFSSILKDAALDSIPKTVALVVGLMIALFDVYLHRIHMMRKAHGEIRKMQRQAETSCCSLVGRLITHNVFLMLFNIIILVAIGLRALEDNRVEICRSEVLQTGKATVRFCSKAANYTVKIENGTISSLDVADPFISDKAWIMIVSGFVIPILSLIIFLQTNVLWFQESFVLLLQGVMSKEEDESLPEEFENATSKVKTDRRRAKLADMLDDRNVLPGYTCWNRQTQSVFNPISLLLVFLYWSSVFAFAYYTAEINYRYSSLFSVSNFFVYAIPYAVSSLVLLIAFLNDAFSFLTIFISIGVVLNVVTCAWCVFVPIILIQNGYCREKFCSEEEEEDEGIISN